MTEVHVATMLIIKLKHQKISKIQARRPLLSPKVSCKKLRTGLFELVVSHKPILLDAWHLEHVGLIVYTACPKPRLIILGRINSLKGWYLSWNFSYGGKAKKFLQGI
jgi:hypothetical protein